MGAKVGTEQSETPPEKGVIPTPPPAQYDPKKLATANNTLDILNAMTPQSRQDYMDWWERQHEDIDIRYCRLQQQVGLQPQHGLSKTEKFAALLEFALHLLKASQTVPAGATKH